VFVGAVPWPEAPERRVRRLGNHIARLPLGWFQANRAGSVGRLTSQGVIDVMGVPAHLLRPVVIEARRS